MRADGNYAETCRAPNSQSTYWEEQQNWIDIGIKFRCALLLMLICSVIDIAHSIARINSILKLGRLHDWLSLALYLNYLFGGGIFIWLHILRFSFPGSNCSGDNLSFAVEQYPFSGYYYKEWGSFIKGLIIYIWILPFPIFCSIIGYIITKYFQRRYHQPAGQKEEDEMRA